MPLGEGLGAITRLSVPCISNASGHSSPAARASACSLIENVAFEAADRIIVALDRRHPRAALGEGGPGTDADHRPGHPLPERMGRGETGAAPCRSICRLGTAGAGATRRRLQAHQVVRRLLGLAGRREDRPVVGLQDSDPALEVLGVILPGLRRHPGLDAQEGRNDLRHQLHGGIGRRPVAAGPRSGSDPSGPAPDGSCARSSGSARAAPRSSPRCCGTVQAAAAGCCPHRACSRPIPTMDGHRPGGSDKALGALQPHRQARRLRPLGGMSPSTWAELKTVLLLVSR